MPVLQSSSLQAYGALALTMLFWAGNAIVGRAVRADIPPFTLAFGRWAIAAAVLAPFAMRAVIADWAEVRRSWRTILFLGLVGVAAFNGFLYSGLRYTTASNGLLLQALIPALVLLISALAFRDRATAGQVLGVMISTVGVAIIVFRGDPKRDPCPEPGVRRRPRAVRLRCLGDLHRLSAASRYGPADRFCFPDFLCRRADHGAVRLA